MINIFYKDYLEKLTIIFLSINFTMLIVKLSAKIFIKTLK